MNNAYKGYLLDCWKFAEGVASEMGTPSNEVVIAIFNKVVSPYHFFKHMEK